jgi:hypothetical protein
MIVQVAKETKDKRILTKLAKLAKLYKLHNKKADLEKIITIISLANPNMRISSSRNISSEDKDEFINFLTRVAASDSPVRSASHIETLNRFLKK